MKKIFKILIVFTLSALLLFPFDSYAETVNDFVFTGAISQNAWVTVDKRPYVVYSGYNEGTSFTCYNTSVKDEVSYVFRVPVKLVSGDVFSMVGTICIPIEISLLQIVIYNHYFTQVDYMGNCVVVDPQGSLGYPAKWYSFNISFTENQTNPTDELIIILSWHNEGTNNKGSFLGVQSMQYSVNNDPSVALNQQAQIINNNNNENAQKIIQAQQNATNSQTNENFGYSAPNSNTTTGGITAGGNLIDSLNAHIDNFNSSLGSNVDNLLNSIQGFKTIVHNIFDVFPTILQYLVIFGLIFLILRKVVGR